MLKLNKTCLNAMHAQMMILQNLMWIFPLLSWTSIKWMQINIITITHTNTHAHTMPHKIFIRIHTPIHTKRNRINESLEMKTNFQWKNIFWIDKPLALENVFHIKLLTLKNVLFCFILFLYFLVFLFHSMICWFFVISLIEIMFL
jgi:hypothetical protein